MDNFLVSANPTVTFLASGGAVANAAAAISQIQPVKQGFATGIALGTYSALVDTFYRIEIHVGGTGAFGSAQWRWTDNAFASPIVWNASNLTTQNNVPVLMNNGVQWLWNQMGSFTPQFALNDYWLFATVLRYGYQKGLDGDRNHEYRSGTMPTSSTIEQRYDMGSAVQPTAAAVLDFNAPSNAIIAWKAKSSGFTDPPDVTIPMTWNSGGKIATLITSNAYRYWRFCVTLAGTSLTYLRWSDLFLGSSLTMSRQFSTGFQRERESLRAVNVDTLRRGVGPYEPEGEILRVRYHNLHSTDQAKLATLRTWSNDPVSRLRRPFYFLPRDDVLSDFSLYQWTNGHIQTNTVLDYYDVEPEFAEVVRTRVA